MLPSLNVKQFELEREKKDMELDQYQSDKDF